MNAGSLVDLQDYGFWTLTNVGKGKMTASVNLLVFLVLACSYLNRCEEGEIHYRSRHKDGACDSGRKDRHLRYNGVIGS